MIHKLKLMNNTPLLSSNSTCTLSGRLGDDLPDYLDEFKGKRVNILLEIPLSELKGKTYHGDMLVFRSIYENRMNGPFEISAKNWSNLGTYDVGDVVEIDF